MPWRDTFSDINSLDFHKMAFKSENNLMQLMTEVGISNVEAVNIVAARKGSVIVSISLKRSWVLIRKCLKST